MRKAIFLTMLYRDNAHFLYNLCRKKTGYDPLLTDLIDECIQDTFVIAVENYESIKMHPNIRGWLVRTCMNRLLPAVEKQRRYQRMVECSIDDPSLKECPFESTLEGTYESHNHKQFLDLLISSLSYEEFNIYEEYFLHRLTMKQIAQQYHTNINHIKNIIKRIRRKAKKMRNQDE